MIVKVKCIRCATDHSVFVPDEAYKRWATGKAHIQDALPMLTDDERELLLSDICPSCWNKIFGGI